jgi:hypothetical protein
MKQGTGLFVRVLSIAAVLALAACGGGGDTASSSTKPLGTGTTTGTTGGTTGTGGTGTGGTGTGGTGSTTTAPTPPPATVGTASLVMTLADPLTGASTTSVPAIARAIVRDASGVAVPNAVVTFTTNSSLASMVPSSGTALTDATGTATIQLNAASLSAAGAATISAGSQVTTAGVTTAVNGSIAYAVGAASVTITNFTFGTNPLSAFGTTSVSVTVNSNGAPVTTPTTVTFSSPCATSNKAVLTSSVLTGTGGVATASYRDNGCGGNDIVTASVSGLATTSLSLAVAVPQAGSIQFVSATPTSITLKGTGGAGRQETSQVIFKVVDTGGNALSTSQTVNFSLSTTVGGITFANGLTTSTATSDPTTGQAVVTVQAGVVSTPVRVLASTTASGVTLSTQSDQLTISTGIPTQPNFSVSPTKHNIEGWDLDGQTAVLTARLADHFGNPVPDGTAVNFITEGGSIGNNGLGACTTTQGSCTATFTSQNLRPTNGRVTVLAYAVGEEGFTDTDGDGLADKVPAELVDANGVSTDLPEAFRDDNENGARDAGETFIDFNNNGTYDVADGKFNGVLCNETAPGTSSVGTCSTQKTIHVFQNIPMIFSGSDAVITFYDPTFAAPITGVTFSNCSPATPYVPSTSTIKTVVTDVNGNVMPAGTTVAFAITNGTITSAASSFTVPDSTACLAGSTGCPASSSTALDTDPLTYTTKIKTAQTQTGSAAPFTCTASANSPGEFQVTVTTPNGTVTRASITVTN